jgi:CBS domain containing-hemolysin-like protein
MTLFFFLKKEEEPSFDELHHIVKTSQESGVLHPREAKLITGYLQLQNTSVREIMRPREDVIFFETEENSLHDLHHLFVDKQCSRIPVSEKGLDNIKGILTTHQYFLCQEQIEEPDDLFSFLEKPFFIPETNPARTVLRQLRERDQDMALVVDEYGSITGLITEEDIVEVIVGPIIDHRDEKSLYTRAGNDIIIASGKLELADFTELFKVELSSENNMVSLGGWLTEKLGDIPKSGTKLIDSGFLFHVLASEPNRVRRIYIRKLPESSLSKMD